MHCYIFCLERKIIVMGNSLLKGTEGPICQPDPTHREVCCIPGARVRVIARKVTCLVRPTNYYPLLVFQAGNDKVAKRSPRVIKRVFRALGQLVKGSEVQVVFPSVLPTVGIDADKQTRHINTWLWDWCNRQNFGFVNHGKAYATMGLLVPDGMRLSQRGKRIFAQELAGLTGL